MSGLRSILQPPILLRPCNFEASARGIVVSAPWRKWMLFTVGAAAIFLRSPRLFFEPRFWAEEGRDFFSFAFSHSAVEALTRPDGGNYDLREEPRLDPGSASRASRVGASGHHSFQLRNTAHSDGPHSQSFIADAEVDLQAGCCHRVLPCGRGERRDLADHASLPEISFHCRVPHSSG